MTLTVIIAFFAICIFFNESPKKRKTRLKRCQAEWDYYNGLTLGDIYEKSRLGLYD